MTPHNYQPSEADTRAELIEPKLREAGWGITEKSFIRREYVIRIGRILDGYHREEKLFADYALFYKNQIAGIVEAKKSSLNYREGIAQAKLYAGLLKARFAYSTNGHKIYQIDMQTGEEKDVSAFPSPETLYNMAYKEKNVLWEMLSSVPYETAGHFEPRYYQNNAVNAVIKAMAQGKKRILLTLATGTGKTCIAFQIVWKLFQTKWNLSKTGTRRPRVLFLADRNILADQAYNAFEPFGNARRRISPGEIKKDGKVPTSEHIFFTIFQTFMAGEKPHFGQYPKNFFDFIIIDECHRGGANDESRWRGIMDYFESAVQLGLTATPKRDVNADTYAYFGEPVYEYSLKEGINDGFLTPFRVRAIQDNFAEYEYCKDDEIDGEIDAEHTYTENEINRKIRIPEREEARVKAFMSEICQMDKTLVFCYSQEHAAEVRDLINQEKTASTAPNYCARVTADDGEAGNRHLRQFQDTEKTIPAILTTSQKLSTGVDAIQVKNIVLMRPINSMVEFKQIIGRGTRLCDGKAYFTIYDFVGASRNFADPEWDGPPLEPAGTGGAKGGNKKPDGTGTSTVQEDHPEYGRITVVKLGNGRSVQIMSSRTLFYDSSGKPVSARQFIENIFHALPDFFVSEDDLRKKWGNPETRSALLKDLEARGYALESLEKAKEIINAKDSDVFDLLCHIAYGKKAITRRERAELHKQAIFENVSARQRDFIGFVLAQYVENGIMELDSANLSGLITLKYGTPADGITQLGHSIRETFCSFQQYLYMR